jgi:hypothetical protein
MISEILRVKFQSRKVNQLAKPVAKDNLEASVDVGDIDERLSKLQDLLRMAKS